MSKLPTEHRFVDLSDYGRPAARWIVGLLLHTRATSIHLTFAFLVVGLAGLYLVYLDMLFWGAMCLLAKNVLDAADGEMARARERPMQTGRYLDSIFDFLINLGLCYVVYLTTGVSVWLFLVSFLCIEFQGTVFNFYYLVQRKICGGDATSQINEFRRPDAFDYENERLVRALHSIYLVFYGPFDWIMLRLDKAALTRKPLPDTFMTLVSSMGLGFQILIIAVLLMIGRVEWILPFFLWYTLWVVSIIVIRRTVIGRN